MKIVCGYCQKAGRPSLIGYKESDLWPADAESHGVCPPCETEQLAQIALMFPDKQPAHT